MADPTDSELIESAKEKLQKSAKMHLSSLDEIIFCKLEDIADEDYMAGVKGKPYFIVQEYLMAINIGEEATNESVAYQRLNAVKNDLVNSKKGEIVFPTSDRITVGHYLFSYRALRNPLMNDNTQITDNLDRDVAFGLLTDDEYKYVEEELGGIDQIYISQEGDIRLQRFKVGENEVTIFPAIEEKENELRYFSPKVWGDEPTPSFLKGKENKALIERFKLMKDLQPKDKEADNNKVISKESGMSPITKYYMMRYLGFYLSASKITDDALPKLRDNKLVLDRINISRQDDFDIETELRKILEGDLGDEKIDNKFPFDRLRTIYRYPDDWVEEALTQDIEDIEEPNPWDLDVKYGMLQKFFTILPTNQKTKFYDSVEEQIYSKMPTKKISLTHKPNDMKMVKESDEITIPFLNGSFAVAESMKVFAESDPSDSKKDRLKLRTNLGDKNSQQLITDGTLVNIPGWVILYSETNRKKSFLEAVLNIKFSQIFSVIGSVSSRFLHLSEGLNHVLDMILYIRNNEETLPIKESDLYDVLNTEYEAFVSTVGDTVSTTIIDDGAYTTVNLDRKKLIEGITKPDLLKKFEWFTRSAAVMPPEPEYNTEKDQSIEGVVESVEAIMAYTDSTGLQQNQLTRHNARAFNALGHVVEEMMINSAKRAVSTVEDTALTSDFDRVVMSLIGTNKNPGMAVFHSIVHYQYLFAIVTNPISRWESIDKDIFQQGAMLSLESFLTEPAKKTLLYLLNEKGFIDIGDFSDTSPKFFKVPVAPSVNVANFTGLMNGFSLIMISYYRLMFAQIRNRLVFERKTQTKGKVSKETADLSKYWRDMIADAERNTPSPALFGLVLRWFGQTGTVLEIPTWMPVSPAEMKSDAKMNKNDVLNYLKWSYSNNAVDLEAFSEVAAAYHAAKAMSYLETAKDIASGYADMVERFVEAVHEDMGHAFLFSILTNRNCPDPTKESPEAEKVIRISNIEAIQVRKEQERTKSESESEPKSGGGGTTGLNEAPPPPPATSPPSVQKNTLKFPSAKDLIIRLEGFFNNIGTDQNEIVKNISEARGAGQIIHSTATKLSQEIESVDGPQFAIHDVAPNRPLSKEAAKNAAKRALILFEAFVPPESGTPPGEKEIIDQLVQTNWQNAFTGFDTFGFNGFEEIGGITAMDVLQTLAGVTS